MRDRADNSSRGEMAREAERGGDDRVLAGDKVRRGDPAGDVPTLSKDGWRGAPGAFDPRLAK